MSRQTKPKPTFEIGQTLYVSISGWYGRDTEPKLHEFEVTRFNNTSVYAKDKRFPDHHERRFTIRTMTATNGIGDHYVAYTDPEVYWNGIRRAKESKELRTQLKSTIHTLELHEMQQVDKFIKTLKKM